MKDYIKDNESLNIMVNAIIEDALRGYKKNLQNQIKQDIQNGVIIIQSGNEKLFQDITEVEDQY